MEYQNTEPPEESSPSEFLRSDKRRRGRRPADANQRRAAVLKALSELESARVPFSMGDVAERAGISRATLYRDATLRDLVGAKGEGPEARPVDGKQFAELRIRVETLSREQQRLKALLRHSERRAEEATKRAALLEEENEKYAKATQGQPLTNEEVERVRKESYAEGFTAGTQAAAQRGGGGRPGMAGANTLAAVAVRLPRASLVNARRTLVKQLHPDLFSSDPAAALLATEILKQLNALVGPAG